MKIIRPLKTVWLNRNEYSVELVEVTYKKQTKKVVVLCCGLEHFKIDNVEHVVRYGYKLKDIISNLKYQDFEIKKITDILDAPEIFIHIPRCRRYYIDTIDVSDIKNEFSCKA